MGPESTTWLMAVPVDWLIVKQTITLDWFVDITEGADKMDIILFNIISKTFLQISLLLGQLL